MNNFISNLLEENIDMLSNLSKSYYHDYQYFHAPKIKEVLIEILKQRSSYKRALKEYNKLCEFVLAEKYKKVAETYRKHPEKFAEVMYGFKLMPYQKVLLKLMWNRKV